MTPMTVQDFTNLGAPGLVYVRSVKARDVLGSEEVTTVKGLEIDPDQDLYAVCSAAGEQLAVMADRNSAFAAAVAHELAPVSVH